MNSASNKIFTAPKDWKYLVISSADESQPDAVRNANPFRVESFLKSTGKREFIREVKSISLGRQLLVVVTNNETSEILLKQNSIPGPNPIHIKVSVSDQLGTKQGVFFCRHIEDMTDEDIMKNLNDANKDLKICNIRKLNKRGTDGHWVPSGSYVVSMRCSEFPNEIKVGWTIQPIRRFIPEPMRCFRCNKLGHTGKRCRELNENQKNCINCNQPQHNEPGTKCSETPFCANCNSTAHNSAFRGCQKYMLEKRVNTLMAERDIPRRAANLIAINEPELLAYQRKVPTMAERLALVATTPNPSPQTIQTAQSSNTLPPKPTPVNQKSKTNAEKKSDKSNTSNQSIDELSDIPMTPAERLDVKALLMAKRKKEEKTDDTDNSQKSQKTKTKRPKRNRNNNNRAPSPPKSSTDGEEEMEA